MIGAMLLKIFADCCLIFGLLGISPLPHAYPLILPALICAVSVAVATAFAERERPVLRRLWAGLPFLCFLLAGDWAQTVILVIPVAYAVLLILCGRLELEYYSYRSFFIKSLILLAVTYGLISVWSILANAAEEDLGLSSGVLLRYGMIYCACGVVMQRWLRMGVDHHGRKELGQLLGTAFLVTVLVLGLAAAEPLLLKGLTVGLQGVILVLSGAIQLIGLLGTWFIEILPEKDRGQDTTQTTAPASTAAGVVGDQFQQVTDAVQEEGGTSWAWVVILTICILIAGALLYRSFRKRQEESAGPALIRRLRNNNEKKKMSAQSYRKRVRQYYRHFLQMERSFGVKLRRSDTTESIHARISAETDEAAAAQLRQVYLQARYDDRHETSRAQAEQAKRALKQSRKKQGE